MTDIYDDPPEFEGKLKPYPHAEKPEVSADDHSSFNVLGLTLFRLTDTHPLFCKITTPLFFDLILALVDSAVVRMIPSRT